MHATLRSTDVGQWWPDVDHRDTTTPPWDGAAHLMRRIYGRGLGQHFNNSARPSGTTDREGQIQYRQGATLAAYLRGQDYYTRYAELLGPFADSPSRRRLDRVVRSLEIAFAGQVRTAKAAAVQPDVFVKTGLLRRTFLNDFDAAIDALQDTIIAREGELLEHRRHCLAVVGLIVQGRQVLTMLT